MSDPRTNEPRSFVADSLAAGLLVMLAMTVVQRAIGLFRGIWFCRLLDAERLGQWSMAFDFVVMVTPMVLLGIPGSLPRYVEHYRNQGHLRAFVRYLLNATLLLGAILFLALISFPAWFGWLIFSQPSQTKLVVGVAICAITFIAFGFVNQLVSALRQVRVVSRMQFVQGVAFTVMGVVWLSYGGDVAGLILCFAAATLLAMIPGLAALRSGWQGLPRADEGLQVANVWRRLLPYAAALWTMNLLINVFSLTDRYLILHLLPGDELSRQAAVGQYHSGRILPTLLMSLATMVSGVVMPYLTADWEGGRQARVRERMQQMLFGVSASFTAGAAVSLWIAPWLFTEFLQGRYATGLDLMPMAFVIAIWFSLATVGQEYLWVAERGKWVGLAIAAGLFVNIAVALVLLPAWGLHGAVVSTLIANGFILAGILWAMMRHGYPRDMSLLFLVLLPVTLLAGPWIATAFVVATAMASPQVRGWCTEAKTMLHRNRSARATTG